MNSHLLYLYKQYCEAVGKKYVAEDIVKDFNEFEIWLKYLKRMLFGYKDYIEHLNIDLYDNTTIEVNKGYYDSLDNGYISIVSPFAVSMGMENSRICDFPDSTFIRNRYGIFFPEQSNTIITHNPYSKKYLSGFDKFNDAGIPICIGVFGSNYDSDKESKIELMKQYKDSLENLKIFYDTYDDDYFCVVKSSKVLEYVKTHF